MEAVIAPPKMFWAIAGGILVIALLSLIIKKGNWQRKITALIIVVVILAGFMFVTYRPISLLVDSTGLSFRKVRTTNLLWHEIEQALYIENLIGSEYKPQTRMAGTGIGSYKVGRFRLRDGSPAHLYMEQEESVLLIRTAERRYLFGPKDIEPFVDDSGEGR